MCSFSDDSDVDSEMTDDFPSGRRGSLLSPHLIAASVRNLVRISRTQRDFGKKRRSTVYLVSMSDRQMDRRINESRNLLESQ